MAVNPASHAAKDYYAKLCNRCTSVLSQRPQGEKFSLHPDGPDILKAADDGCRVCQLLVTEVQSSFGGDELPETLQHVSGTQCEWIGRGTEDCTLNIYVLFVFPPSQEEYCLAHLYITVLDPFKSQAPPDESNDTTIYGTISSDFTGSDACLSRVLTWHRDCLRDHSKCGQLRSRPEQDAAWYPTRLLDVGAQTDQAVRLVISETSQCEGHYMTLSHRWGTGPVPYRLTSDTLPTLLSTHGVCISELPRTFREAIEVTRRFGVRYLWIDSMCIIQDSDEDWQKESAQMVDVYSHSHLNIAATASDNAEQGLFRRRQADPSWPWHALATSGNGEVRRCVIYDREMLLKGLGKAPLNSRAWVMQERFLAPRVVHFGESQLFWECHEQTASEMFPSQIPSHASRGVIGPGKSLDADYLVQTNDSFRVAHRSNYPYLMWDMMVEQYMQCAVTKPQDKLVAISGLAQHIARTMDNADTYLAGLWQSRLPQQLLWLVDSCQQADRSASHRPRDYHAPSWSWASVEAQVIMPALRDNNTHDLVTVRDVSVTPVGGHDGDAFGQLVGGWIKLRGMLLTRLRIEVNNDRPCVFKTVEWVYIAPDVPQDMAVLTQQCQWVDCMPIVRYDEDGGDKYVSCLLLQPRRAQGNNKDTDAKTCYERFGYAQFREDSLAVWDDSDAGADMRRRAGCGWIRDVDITIV